MPKKMYRMRIMVVKFNQEATTKIKSLIKLDLESALGSIHMAQPSLGPLIGNPKQATTGACDLDLSSMVSFSGKTPVMSGEEKILINKVYAVWFEIENILSEMVSIRPLIFPLRGHDACSFLTKKVGFNKWIRIRNIFSFEFRDFEKEFESLT